MERILNHDVCDAASEEELIAMGGGAKYSTRVLGSTFEDDIVQFNPSLKKSWDWIHSHYNRIGLEHSSNIIWEDKFNIVRDYDHELDVFIYGEKAFGVRPNRNWFEIVKVMNSKNEFIKICSENSIATPKTFIYNDKNEIEDSSLFNFPSYLKLSVSVSGLGVMKCNNEKELEKELEKVPVGLSIQIQEGVEAKAFLNVQYEITNEGCKRLLVSEQILKGAHHDGNRFPSVYNPWGLTDPIAEIMYSCGMKGIFAFDVAVDEDNSMYMIECNPRYNGATYPTKIASKLGINRWITKNIATSVKSINDIDLGVLEYNNKKGVIAFNWGTVDDGGKLGVLIAANNDKEELKLEDDLRRLLA